MRLGGIDAVKGVDHVGEQGVPKDATDVRLALNVVTFNNASKWISKD
jgi:hypothetical protein